MNESAQPWQHLHVVGMVASAGGLDAMLELLPRLKPTGHTAWVLAQHMGSQAQGDLMARLLGRASHLPVVMGQSDQTLQADTVYMIPAGCDGRVEQGTLRLSPPAVSSISTPSGNELLASLAVSHPQHCTAVVLSGAGRDGVEGARSIRLAGGRVFVQDPQSVKFNGMPSAAVEAGVVDAALPISALADALNGQTIEPCANEHTQAMSCETGPIDAQSADWSLLLARVYEVTGVDFSGYKEDTLLRRVQRRLTNLRLLSLHAYLVYCQHHPQELHTLQQHFLVSFSSFFRDRVAFQVVRQALHERLLHKPPGSLLRVWVPACAGGEEAYTLAIVLAELMGGAGALHGVSILGTDLNPGAIDVARAGCYRPSALREVDTDLMQRYFIQQGHHWVVSDALRACCRFEQRNVFDVASLEPYDMVSCRNLLIYLKPEWQTRLLQLLYRVLMPDGLLFVAPVESMGVDGSRLFIPLDRDHRLYRRRAQGKAATPLE